LYVDAIVAGARHVGNEQQFIAVLVDVYRWDDRVSLLLHRFGGAVAVPGKV